MTINYPDLTDRLFLKKYLNLYNLLAPEAQHLEPAEIDLIIEFVLLPEDKFGYQRFSSLAKDKVIEAAALYNWNLTKLNINNKLYALLDKKFLRRDEDKVIYLPSHILSAYKVFKEKKQFKVDIFFNGSA
jgi:hypothetical protein